MPTLDLFGRELLAVDSTRIKAVNNKDRNFTRAALAKITGAADDKLSIYMAHPNEGDVDEAADGSVGRDTKLAEKIAAIRGRRERHKALLDELDRSGEDQISLTDPDARAMTRMTRVGVGYNVRFAVDTKHKLIAEQEVTNQVLDIRLLAPTVTATMEALGVETIEAVADKGYFKFEDIDADVVVAAVRVLAPARDEAAACNAITPVAACALARWSEHGERRKLIT